MRAIEEFEVSARTTSLDDFAQAHPAPVFVYCGGNDGVLQSGAHGFKTQLVRSSFTAKIQAGAVGAAAVPINAVFEAIKQPGAPYPDRISIGRTKVSDICLPLPQVSKLHAYLTWNEGRTVFTLADGGTTNGTLVSGNRLTANVPTPVADGSVVAFGPYSFRFFLPAGFYAFARALKHP